MQFLTILAVVLGFAAHGERLTAFGATPAFRQVPPVQPATPQPTTPQPATPRPQRRSVANAALGIVVSDPSGAPIGDVKITMTGPVSRTGRTERGRIAFENLPAGTYLLRFDREGFISFEREVIARGGAPIDVKVTLTPEPPPPPPPAPVVETPPKPPAPALSPDPVAIDMPAFIEKNYVGRRAPGKTSVLACTTGGPATLIQVKDPIVEHVHADADEFLYTISGEGSVSAAGSPHPLRAGVFMMVPRGVPHIIVAVTRNPLMLLSIRAGEECSGK
jgi:mannose-6-phosphate isomerase-like protein (cupin superfamily)